MQSPIATTSFLAKFVASKLQNGDGSGLALTLTPRFQSVAIRRLLHYSYIFFFLATKKSVAGRTFRYFSVERGERVDSLFSSLPHRSPFTRHIFFCLWFRWPAEGLYPSVTTPFSPVSSLLPVKLSLFPFPLCVSPLVFEDSGRIYRTKRFLSVYSATPEW